MIPFVAALLASQTAGPDLAAVAIDVADTAFRGQAYRLRGTIENQGDLPITDFYAAFYLSRNELITISDPQLAEIGPLSLEPGERSTVDQWVTIDSATERGEYYVGFVCDSREAVAEDDELDNIKRTTGTITVRDIAPDLVASEITVPVSAGSGESFWVQRVLENAGNDEGSADYLVFLVADGTSVRVAVIGSGSIALGPGELHLGADLVTVPADAPPGTYRVEYQIDPEELLDELDEANNLVRSVNALELQPAQLAIVSGEPSLAVIGVPYEFDLVARGGTGPITWEITQGALPVGLSLDTTTGRISGVPSIEGVSTFGVRVSDGSLFHERPLAIRVIPPTTELRIVTRAIPPAWVETPYDYPLVAIGGVEPYDYTVSPQLPDGLELTDDGRIKGTTATVAPSLVHTFAVTDASGARAETSIAFRVLARNRAVRLDQAALPDGVVGDPYDVPLNAAGGVEPYTFAVASGELPVGLTIANGRIAGAPAEAGEFIFELSVTDDAKDSDRNFYVVRISAADRVRFMTRSLPPAVVGREYRDPDGGAVQVRAITPGSTGDVSYRLFNGTFPPGLTFAEDGTISGTPTTAGVYAFILAAHDSLGEEDFRAFGIVVEASETLPDEGCGCTAAEDRSPISLLPFVLMLLPIALRRRSLFALVLLIAPATASASQDVFASEIEPNASIDPVRVYGGVPFEVRARVSSNHDDPLGPFQYAVHLADANGTLVTPAVLTSSPITLAPYEDREVVESITLPLDTMPGRYGIALVVDVNDAIAEPNESNNVVLSRREILIAERRPDFTVVRVTPMQTSVMPGGTLDVELELRNAGNLDGAASWRAVLSGNSTPSVDDVFGASSSTDQTLTIGSTATISATIEVPADLTPGRYHVGLIVDPTNAVPELLEVNNTGASIDAVQIGRGALEILTALLPLAHVGLEYRATLSASGGTGVVTWSVAGGTLPEGIALMEESGQLIGTPSEDGTFSITFRARSGTASEEATLEIVVAPIEGPLTIVTRRLLPGLAGFEYPPRGEEEQRIIAVGGAGPATLTNTSSLPPGLSLEQDGLVHGVPAAAGDYFLVIEAFDGMSRATREIPLTIVEPGRLALIGERLPDAKLGEAYAHSLAVAGANPIDPPIFSLVAGQLPNGLVLSDQGEITGAAMVAGAFVFNVEVREAASGARDTATLYLTVTTDEALPIEPASIPVATLNQPYEAVLTAQGGTEPVRWVIDYSIPLPRGLMEERVEIDGVTKFRIFGTPEEIPENGVLGILVKAQDATGRLGKQAYALAVVEPDAVEEEGCGCRAAREDTSGSGWLIPLLWLAWSRRARRRFRFSVR